MCICVIRIYRQQIPRIWVHIFLRKCLQPIWLKSTLNNTYRSPSHCTAYGMELLCLRLTLLFPSAIGPRDCFSRSGIFRVFQSGPRVRRDWEICVILVNLGVFTIVINLETDSNSCPTWIYIVSVVHYYKPEVVIFECPRYLWIKEEKILKVLGASDWEISSIFWKIRALFPLGIGSKFVPQNSLEKSLKILVKPFRMCYKTYHY